MELYEKDIIAPLLELKPISLVTVIDTVNRYNCTTFGIETYQDGYR